VQKDSIDLYVLNKMPLATLPEEVHASIKQTKNVLAIEEHIAIGGLGSAVALLINEGGLVVNKFISLHAKGYPGGLYGSQAYHQQESGLDEENILKTINSYF
jgi:transketolase